MLSPDRQEALSLRYVPQSYRLLPLRSGAWAVIDGHGTAEVIAILPATDLIPFLSLSFEGIMSDRRKAEDEQALQVDAASTLLKELGL